MATCPRCLGSLTEGHKCRPIWIHRLKRQVAYVVTGGLFGAFVQELAMPSQYPVLGTVFGGLLFFGLYWVFKND